MKRLRSLLNLAGFPVQPSAGENSRQSATRSTSQALATANSLVITTAHSPFLPPLPGQKVIHLPGIEDSSWFSPSAQADFLCQVDQFFHPNPGPVGILSSQSIFPSQQSTQADPLVLGSLLAQALSVSNRKTGQKTKKAPGTGLLILGETPWWWQGQGASAQKINQAETHYLAHTLQRLIPQTKELKCAVLCDFNQLSRLSITRLLPVLARAYLWIVVAGVAENKLYFAGGLHSFPIPITARYPQARKIRYLLEIGINPLSGQGKRQSRYFKQCWSVGKQRGNYPAATPESPAPDDLTKLAAEQEINYE